MDVHCLQMFMQYIFMGLGVMKLVGLYSLIPPRWCECWKRKGGEA